MLSNRIHTSTRLFTRIAVCFLLLTVAISGCDTLEEEQKIAEQEAATFIKRTEGDPLPVEAAPKPEPKKGPIMLIDAGIHPHEVSHSIEEFEYFLEQIERVETRAELNAIVSSAMMTLHHLPEDEFDKEALMRALTSTAASVDPPSVNYTTGFLGAGDCDIDFNTPSILDTFEEDAEYTFTKPSYFWWEQSCDQETRMVVESAFYNHFHLAYEDDSIQLCTFIEPGAEGMGREITEGQCDRVDPLAEPRDVGLHWGNDVLIVRRLDNADNPMPFNFDRIANVFSTPIEVRYKKQDGTWNGWHSLGGYTTWNLAPHTNGVIEIQISHENADPDCGPDWKAIPGADCDTEYGPIFVDNFEITF